MLAVEIPGLLEAVRQPILGQVENLIGNLTALLSIVAATVVLGKQLLGDGMICFNPGWFTDEQMVYIQNKCYIISTYFVPWSDVDINKDRSKYSTVDHYQYLGVVFLGFAVLFWLPAHFWQNSSRRNPIVLRKLVELGRERRDQTPEERPATSQEMCDLIVPIIQESVTSPPTDAELKSDSWCSLSLIFGPQPFSLTLSYLLLKVGNLSIVGFVLWACAAFLDSNDFFWSLYRFIDICSGKPWTESKRFPVVTFCDLPTRDLANTRPNTIQCFLGTNFVAEKVFAVFWLWLLGVLIYAFINFIWTMSRLFTGRSETLLNYLNRSLDTKYTKEDARWLNDILGSDGFLVLYFLQTEVGDRPAADFSQALFAQLQKEGIKTPEVHPGSFSETFIKLLHSSLPSLRSFPNKGRKDSSSILPSTSHPTTEDLQSFENSLMKIANVEDGSCGSHGIPPPMYPSLNEKSKEFLENSSTDMTTPSCPVIPEDEEWPSTSK